MDILWCFDEYHRIPYEHLSLRINSTSHISTPPIALVAVFPWLRQLDAGFLSQKFKANPGRLRNGQYGRQTAFRIL
jgi:hypothetical protein